MNPEAQHPECLEAQIAEGRLRNRKLMEENRAFRRAAHKGSDSREMYGVSRLPNRRTTFLRDISEIDREVESGAG